MDKELKAKNFYRPLTQDQWCYGSDEVGKVLDRIDTVHGGLLVFNPEKEFLGVLSSYKTIYKNHTPPGKKVANALIHPMVITKETPLSQIAIAMSSAKLYILPIFDNNQVIGTIDALDIVKRLFHDQNLMATVSEELKIDHPMLLDTKAKVKDAYALLRANGVSEVIITDKVSKIIGVVTRSDIKHAFIHPTDKQRFSHDNFRPDDLSFDAEKKKRVDESITGYLSTAVPTINEKATQEEQLIALLSNEQQFLVITNDAMQAVGIVSYRNILEAIANISEEQEVNIIMEKPSPNVLLSEFNKAQSNFSNYIQKMNKRLPLERAEMRVQESKYPTGKTAEFEITLQLDPITGSQFVVNAKEKQYLQSIRSAMRQMDKILEKTALKNKKHHKMSLSQALNEPLKQLYR
jgi:predicted transcriptional regulator/ribosome-associated translation inhibitor RaiA